MATFAGITFSERGTANGALLPVHGVRSKYAVLPCPGGVNIFLQKLGYDAVTLDIPARVTASQLASLRALVSTSGSLVYAGGGPSVTLADINQPTEVKQPNDMYFVTLSFIVPW